MSKSVPGKKPATKKKTSSSFPEEADIKSFITWFEIPVHNFDRALNFYNHIYQMEMETSEVNGHTMAFFPHTTGIGGALIAGEGSIPSDKGPLIYLNAGRDMDGILHRINESGGSILMGKTLINETAGHFALFRDTEGNKLALHAKPNL